jgi:hypothetical protein
MPAAKTARPAAQTVRPTMKKSLSHVDARGRIRMVDVSQKPATAREAVARGFVQMAPATLSLIGSGKIAKGDPLQAARDGSDDRANRRACADLFRVFFLGRGAILRVRSRAYGDLLPIGRMKPRQFNAQVSQTFHAARKLRFNDAAFDTGTAFGDDEIVHDKGLIKRPREFIAGPVAVARKPFTQPNR